MSETEARGLFGQIALSKGYVSREQLLEALDEQARARAAGESIELGQILLRRQLLSTDQFVEVLRLQNRCILKCSRCGRGFNVLGLPRDRAVTCIACGAPLEMPSTIHDLQSTLDNQLAVTVETTGAVEAARLKIGRYELVREIARGGMAIVMEAHDPVLNRRIALKVIKESPRTRDLVKRLYREAEIAASLRHPNIVNIHEVGTEGTTHYIAMEYVEGMTLQELLAAGPVPPREAARMLAEVAAAVHHAHAHGVIHRDLKPGNILLDGAKRVVVTDFGLARAETRNARMTQAGSPLGTPHYMSPEQVRGRLEEIDAQSDVFALGVVLYEMLCGRRPFEGRTPLEVYARITREAPAPLDIDPSLWGVCARALEKDKAKRYPTAQAMADDLQRFLAGTLPAPAPPAPEQPSAERRLIVRAIAVVAVALLLIAGGAMVRGAVRRASRAAELRVQAERAEQEGRLEEAARAYEELAGVDPDSSGTAAVKAHELRQQAGQGVRRQRSNEALARAQAELDRHRTEEPQDDAHLQAAVREFLAALRHDPSNAAARMGLADLAWQQLLKAEEEGSDGTMWRQLVEQHHDGLFAEGLKGLGSIEVAMDPPDAEALLDDRPVAGAVTVPIGAYVLTVRHDGYREARLPLRVARLQRLMLSVRLFTEAQIGADFAHVPGGEGPIGDFFLSRRPFPAETCEAAIAHAERLTEEARRRGEHVSYRLPAEEEWERAARHASVYGIEGLATEWCTNGILRGFGSRLTNRREGGSDEKAAFRLVRVLEE